MSQPAPGAPVVLLLSRLDGVRATGRGWSARCPAHEDRSASLSIAEGRDDRALVKCFAGCNVHAVLSAIGLELADLFAGGIRDTSPAGRAEARDAWQRSGWAAALGVLAREATVVLIAARMLARGDALPPDDLARLQLAIDRIEGAREVLT
jgi:hypothetical protein